MAKPIVKVQNTKPRRAQLGQRRRIQGINADFDDVKIRGKKFRGEFTDAVTSAELVRTIEGASSLTIGLHDDDHKLVNHRLLKAKFDVELDGLFFRYLGVDDDGSGSLTARFESQPVARLREQTGHLKILRDTATRAEFILMMIREIKRRPIPFYSPELHKVQPIRNKKELRRSKVTKDEQREPGFGPNPKFTVKGVRADPEQIKNAGIILDVAMSLGANFRVMVMGIACATQENVLHNDNPGDAAGPDSRGLFAQRLQYYPNAADPVKASREFFAGDVALPGGMIAYERAHPKENFGTSINAIQRSQFPDAYNQWHEEAIKTVKEYLGGSTAGGATTIEQTKEIPYAYERGKKENSWKAGTRLAEEVNWRLFESAGMIYYVTDDYLLKSRIRMRLFDGAKGIDKIAANYNANRKVQEANISGRARDLAAPPGTVAVIEGRGMADGRYLVHEIKSNLFNDDFEANLRRPTPALPEPPAETKTITRTIPGNRSRNRGGGGEASADALADVNLKNNSSGAPYWGGAWPLFKQFVIPFMAEQGLTNYTGKRPYNTGSGLSDHFTGSTRAFAGDFGTYSGETAARKIAHAMGFDGWSPNVYQSFTIKVDGLSFSCQVLWGSEIDHGDHVHVGAHRI